MFPTFFTIGSKPENLKPGVAYEKSIIPEIKQGPLFSSSPQCPLWLALLECATVENARDL